MSVGLRAAPQEQHTGLRDRGAVLDELGLHQAQAPAVLPHPGMHFDRFQSCRARQVDGQTRRLQLRIVHEPFGSPSQQAADRVAARSQAVNALRRQVYLATLRYDNGYSNFLDVLDAERNLFSAELGLADARRAHLSAVVDLYRALGGGWTPPGP